MYAWFACFAVPLLSVSCVAVSRGIGFVFANESAVLGTAVPAHAFLVVDVPRDIQPHHNVAGAVHLRGRFCGEHLQIAGRDGRDRIDEERCRYKRAR